MSYNIINAAAQTGWNVTQDSQESPRKSTGQYDQQLLSYFFPSTKRIRSSQLASAQVAPASNWLRAKLLCTQVQNPSHIGIKQSMKDHNT